MKLLRLDLLAVGPFTNVVLDLSAGDPGLHVVVGPNEAGKSSALRALTALLYGFGQRTAGEDAVHKSADVRVGGLLRHSDGTELAVVRRRGNQRTLLDPATDKPLPDDALTRFLGTVDAAAFRGFFGLGHDALRAGNEDLLRTDGRVGQALFAAGAGGKPLRVALDRYDEQANNLYKSGGRNQTIPQALSEWRTANEATRAASRPPEDWDAQQAAHAEARRAADQVSAEIATVAAERAQADRVRRAIPLLAERSVALAQLASVADAPRLPPDFAARRAAAEQARLTAARAVADAGRAWEGVTAELADAAVPDAVLARSEAVDGLYRRLAGYQKSVAAAPALRVERDAALAAVARIVADLRPGAPIEPDAVLPAADALRLGTARRARIAELAAEFERLTARQSTARESAAAAATARHRQAADLAALPPPVDVSALSAVVAAATRAGDLDRLLAEARSAAARLAAKADADRRGLPLVAGTVADVEALPVPDAESVHAADQARSAADAEHRRSADEVRKLEQRLAALDRDLDALQLAGPVPTEAEVTAARLHRDELWADLCRAARANARGPFEAAVRHADAVVDSLRRESARVAQRVALTADLGATGAALAAERRRAAAAAAAREAVEADWRTLWSAAAIVPRTPAEMRGWLDRHGDLRRSADAVRAAGAVVASLSDQVASHRAAVAAALGEPAGGGPLAPLLERGRAIVEDARAAASARRRVEEAVRDGSSQSDRLAAAVTAADAAVADWQGRWAAAVDGLGLPAGAGPAEARSTVDRTDALARSADEARQLWARLSAAQADVAVFAADAAALATGVAPELAAASPDAIAAGLRRAVEAGRVAEARRQGLRRQRADAEAAVRRSAAAAASADADLAELCRLAGCEPDGLPEAERRSTFRLEVEGQLRQLENRLLTLNHGEPVEALAALAVNADADAVAVRLSDLDGRARGLEDRRRDLHERVGRATEKLATWDGGGAAADAADRAQAVLARAREAAARYVRLRLAAGVLRHGIDRHRRRRQGPLLTRASQLFAGLTLSSFSSLAADLGDGDDPVLVGVRPAGQRLTVAEMSDGTRDQLYLSLRLAALEDFVDRNEPVPLAVDDVLVHFDDARSRAALAALGELSRRTQVILFTHHEHVAVLAREAAGEAAVVHRLG